MDPVIDIQRKTIRSRRLALESIYRAKAGHTGGSLSCLDILTVLYDRILRVSPDRLDDPDRDRYIQSKGHSVEALYAVLAGEGFFPAAELETLCQYKSPFIGHPTKKIPGIEQNTGALGHGLPIACGTAKAAKLDGAAYRVFSLLGDGELAEGSNWEAAMFASHHKLDNLTAIIDFNQLQISGHVREVMSPEPLRERWEAFGWEVKECDGHDHAALEAVLLEIPWAPGKPNLLIAHTIKGKGISFMENAVKWHHGVPSADQFATALEELERAEQDLTVVKK